jgi:hypothetical protein
MGCSRAEPGTHTREPPQSGVPPQGFSRNGRAMATKKVATLHSVDRRQAGIAEIIRTGGATPVQPGSWLNDTNLAGVAAVNSPCGSR